MGRYAYFHNNVSEQSHEYKFWFGIQDSDIPFARNTLVYKVAEYDEAEADAQELTEEEKKIWEEHAECSYETLKGFTEEEKEVLEFKSSLEYYADDTADDIELCRRWKLVKARGTRLGLLPYWCKTNESLLEALYRYEQEVIDVYNARLERVSDPAKKRKLQSRLADYHLMLTTCCILSEWGGSYHCYYDE